MTQGLLGRAVRRLVCAGHRLQGPTLITLTSGIPGLRITLLSSKFLRELLFWQS